MSDPVPVQVLRSQIIETHKRGIDWYYTQPCPLCKEYPSRCDLCPAANGDWPDRDCFDLMNEAEGFLYVDPPVDRTISTITLAYNFMALEHGFRLIRSRDVK